MSRRTPPGVLGLAMAVLLVLPAPARGAAAEADLQALIDGAVRSGADTLVVPPGVYRCAATIDWRDARGLTIRAEGVTLVHTGRTTSALAITRCREVVLRGLTIDYDPLPFTQGRVTAVDPDGRWAEFALDDGFPDLDALTAVKRMHLFTAEGRWKPGAPDLYAERTEIRSPRLGRMVFASPQPAVAEADRVALNIRADPGIAVRDSPGEVALEGVRILAAPGLAVMQRFCRGRLRVDGLVVEPGPPPAGATAGRLLSSSADGINAAYGRQGPMVTGSDFSGMGDDGFNVHGAALPVVQVEADGALVVVRPWPGEAFDQVCDPGDPVRVLAPGDFAITAEGPLAGIERLAADPGIDPARLRSLHYQVAAKPTYWRLRTAAPLPAAVGDWIDLPAIAAPGWRVAGSRFHDHRGRGLRVMASHGVVEGNRFTRIKQAAVSIGAEYGHWREAGWLEDVVVRGNTIVEVFTGSVPPEVDYAPGAIVVFAALDRKGGPYPPLMRRIAILDNDIRGSGAAGILAYAVRDLVIEGNRIADAAGVPAEAARRHGLPTGVVAVAAP